MSPDCSVLVSVNSHEMIFFNQLDCFLFIDLSDFLEIIIAEFIDSFSDIGLESSLLHEEFLDLQPFIVLDDDHMMYYFVPVEPNPPSPLSVSLSSSTSFKVTTGTGTICI